MAKESSPTLATQVEETKHHQTPPVDSIIQKSPQEEESQIQQRSTSQLSHSSNSQSLELVQESQLNGAPRNPPSPTELQESYEGSPQPTRHHSIRPTRTGSDRNFNDSPHLDVFGYPVNQKDLNMAVILLGVSGFLALLILVLLLVNIALLHYAH